MTDDELIQCFEAGAVPEPFHHAEHVKLTWLYLRRYPVPEVLGRLSGGLKALASARGKPERYHETITWAYVFLLHERMARMDSDHDWKQFAEVHRDLLDWNNNILRAYYREETLRSDLGRKVFLLPDHLAKVSIPSSS
jgi:hypothetical protein